MLFGTNSEDKVHYIQIIGGDAFNIYGIYCGSTQLEVENYLYFNEYEFIDTCVAYNRSEDLYCEVRYDETGLTVASIAVYAFAFASLIND